jgi:hypothetical protein
MINKLLIKSIIDKYYLGENESVKWIIKDHKLSVDFTTINREVIGTITCHNFQLNDCELSIFDTKKLSNLLSITSGDLLLETEQHKGIFTKLHISDPHFNLTYALADPLLIGKVGTVNEPEWDAILPLVKEDVDNLVKAKTALSDVDNMVISTELDLNNDMMCKFTFGDEKGHNNKITYQVYGEIKDNNIKLPFNSNHFRNILNVNKDLKTGTLYICSGGLMKIVFENEDTTSQYYIVRKAEDSF